MQKEREEHSVQSGLWIIPNALSSKECEAVISETVELTEGGAGTDSFSATISVNDSIAEAVGVIDIDRTLFGITYGSSSFFDNLADRAIDNNFTLKLFILKEIFQFLFDISFSIYLPRTDY